MIRILATTYLRSPQACTGRPTTDLVERYEAYNEQWGLEIMRRFGRYLR
jgi:hypothetical protein